MSQTNRDVPRMGPPLSAPSAHVRTQQREEAAKGCATHTEWQAIHTGDCTHQSEPLSFPFTPTLANARPGCSHPGKEGRSEGDASWASALLLGLEAELLGALTWRLQSAAHPEELGVVRGL